MNGYLLAAIGFLAVGTMFGYLVRGVDREWVEQETNARIVDEIRQAEKRDDGTICPGSECRCAEGRRLELTDDGVLCRRCGLQVTT